jgi:hypothetical protein
MWTLHFLFYFFHWFHKEISNSNKAVMFDQFRQYLVEVVQHLTYSSQLVKDGQYLVEVVQPLTYSSKSMSEVVLLLSNTDHL